MAHFYSFSVTYLYLLLIQNIFHHLSKKFLLRHILCFLLVTLYLLNYICEHLSKISSPTAHILFPLKYMIFFWYIICKYLSKTFLPLAHFLFYFSDIYFLSKYFWTLVKKLFACGALLIPFYLHIFNSFNKFLNSCQRKI